MSSLRGKKTVVPTSKKRKGASSSAGPTMKIRDPFPILPRRLIHQLSVLEFSALGLYMKQFKEENELHALARHTHFSHSKCWHTLAPGAASYNPSRSKESILPPSLRKAREHRCHQHSRRLLFIVHVAWQVIDLTYFIALKIQHHTEWHRKWLYRALKLIIAYELKTPLGKRISIKRSNRALPRPLTDPEIAQAVLVPILEQPLMPDHTRRMELFDRLAVHFVGRHHEVSAFFSVLEKRMLLEKKIETALVHDGGSRLLSVGHCAFGKNIKCLFISNRDKWNPTKCSFSKALKGPAQPSYQPIRLKFYPGLMVSHTKSQGPLLEIAMCDVRSGSPSGAADFHQAVQLRASKAPD
ncbi:hypothetical protein GOBAR_AA35402 [Gossypium barbadense]|uniref:Uncharacterized protein n=1 Tax=Gossypium barbadense TaxID=3634 RepID=A0A2P5W2G8_GOSBA|nr:hypothetical protein GOBAR_AA35402 [Gossypium barbadense]